MRSSTYRLASELSQAASEAAAKGITQRVKKSRSSVPRVPLEHPIPLLRRILRAHRQFLQPEQRNLGDTYVKSEFRLHRNIDNAAHIVGFLATWQKYVESIEGDSWKHEKLDMLQLDRLSKEQIGQLYQLMLATRNETDPEEGDSNSGSQS